jgi:hypothetical protein
MMPIFRCGAVLAAWLTFADPVHAQQHMLCPGASVPLDISFAFEPFVRMRLGNREGNFLIDTGSDNSGLDAGLFGVAVGSKVKISGSSLPTVDGGLFRTYDLAQIQQFAPPGGHAGFIGTDILSSRTVEYHYEAAQPYLVLSKQRCTLRQFEDAGFVSISQQGFRSSATWWSWATSWLPAPDRVNIPVIYVQIGTVRAPVWLDSGMAERGKKHAVIMINDALFQQLRDAGIAMNPAGTAENIDCLGTKVDDKQWQVDSAPLVFSTQDGQRLFEYSPPTLQVHAASPCGTIGNHREPLGMVGALFLARWGTVVFDGLNERVWVTSNRTPVSPHEVYRSIALARNETGGWSVTDADSLDSAKAESVSLCNEKRGNCKIEATIGPSQFLCLAIARSAQNKNLPSEAINGSLAAARSVALETCAKLNGATCNLEYSRCND